MLNIADLNRRVHVGEAGVLRCPEELLVCRPALAAKTPQAVNLGITILSCIVHEVFYIRDV